MATLAAYQDGRGAALGQDRGSPRRLFLCFVVVALANGRYQIKSVGSANFANAGNRPPEGTTVEGRSDPQQWNIQETRVRGQYT